MRHPRGVQRFYDPPVPAGRRSSLPASPDREPGLAAMATPAGSRHSNQPGKQGELTWPLPPCPVTWVPSLTALPPACALACTCNCAVPTAPERLPPRLRHWSAPAASTKRISSAWQPCSSDRLPWLQPCQTHSCLASMPEPPPPLPLALAMNTPGKTGFPFSTP